jgi:hypothetical protein
VCSVQCVCVERVLCVCAVCAVCVERVCSVWCSVCVERVCSVCAACAVCVRSGEYVRFVFTCCLQVEPKPGQISWVVSLCEGISAVTELMVSGLNPNPNPNRPPSDDVRWTPPFEGAEYEAFNNPHWMEGKCAPVGWWVGGWGGVRVRARVRGGVDAGAIVQHIDSDERERVLLRANVGCVLVGRGWSAFAVECALCWVPAHRSRALGSDVISVKHKFASGIPLTPFVNRAHWR